MPYKDPQKALQNAKERSRRYRALAKQRKMDAGTYVPQGRHGNHVKGEKHPRWKGGRYVTAAGYVMLYRPNHPSCNGLGYVYEHRLVVEERLGRLLRSDEVVHHRDGDKRNNAAENLEVLNAASHLRLTMSTLCRVRLTKQQHRWLNTVAQRRKCSYGDVIRSLIDMARRVRKPNRRSAAQGRPLAT